MTEEFDFHLFEFSRANQLRQTAIQAAYEGARVGITRGALASDVRAKAQAVLNAVGVKSSSIVVSPSTITPSTSTVSVTVSLDLSASGWLNIYFQTGNSISSTITLDSENKAISYGGS